MQQKKGPRFGGPLISRLAVVIVALIIPPPRHPATAAIAASTVNPRFAQPAGAGFAFITTMPPSARRSRGRAMYIVDQPLPGVCRDSLGRIDNARKRDRDISPELSDALDMAMESLRTALTIMALEGRAGMDDT